jgi:uncharacterized HAD superfamily protein
MIGPFIAFDIDGVVADLFPLISRIMNEKYGVIHTENMQRSYSLDSIPGVSKREVSICINTAIINYLSYKPYYGAIKFLEKYHKFSKRTLHFITSRDNRKEIAEATANWLSLYLKKMPYSIHFTQDKFSVCKELEIDIFIEDRAKTAMEIACKGISVVVIDRPWNRHIPENMWNLVRFNDWIDIDKWMLKETLKYRKFKLDSNIAVREVC